MGDKLKHFTVNVNKTAKNDLREIIKYISKNNPMKEQKHERCIYRNNP